MCPPASLKALRTRAGQACGPNALDVTFLFVAATPSLRAVSLLLGDLVRQAVSAVHYLHKTVAKLRARGKLCVQRYTRSAALTSRFCQWSNARSGSCRPCGDGG